jgi:hypothetical protein
MEYNDDLNLRGEKNFLRLSGNGSLDSLTSGVKDAFHLGRGIGLGLFLSKFYEQLWFTKVFLGLRCDLESLPPIQPAKFPMVMRPQDEGNLKIFDCELEKVKGSEYLYVFQRRQMCKAGVRTLFTALGPDESPAYVQWLIRPCDQTRLQAHQPNRFPILAEDEALLEGAYTFLAYRRTGVMVDGMAQLLRVAQAEGLRAVYTYVEVGNVGSLRGCAKTGFHLDHLFCSSRRLGYRRNHVIPPDEKTRWEWESAISPGSAGRTVL